MSIVDDIKTTGIDLGDFIKLPSVATDVELSNKTMAFVGGVLLVIAFFVFKPFSKRRR